MSRNLFQARVNSVTGISNWTSYNNHSLFDTTYSELDQAPIDTFIQKNRDLNVLIIDPIRAQEKISDKISNGLLDRNAGQELISELTNVRNSNPVLLNLILLGHISALESYIREILRRIILIDKDSKRVCDIKTISFGAANVHAKSMLPEALLESISFASMQNILQSFKDFLGLSAGEKQYPSSLIESLTELHEICVLRHCIIHRFGKLGVKNAIDLKLDLEENEHKQCIEKPIKINFNTIQSVSKICMNSAKEINQALWEKIMTRLILVENSRKLREDIPWVWDLRTDKRLFLKYYNVFMSQIDSPEKLEVNEVYNEYRTYFKSIGRNR